jgi:6-phosphogluconolactonase
MARRELTDHVAATFLAPDTSLPDAEAAAAAYDRVLVPVLERGGEPTPDVVLLGMGPDGHTASLFPGTSALEVDEAGYVATWVQAQDTWRLTATAPLLRAARHLIFMVTGESKADMLRRILVDGEQLPAGLVAAGAADVTWLLDAAAAADLD